MLSSFSENIFYFGLPSKSPAICIKNNLPNNILRVCYKVLVSVYLIQPSCKSGGLLPSHLYIHARQGRPLTSLFGRRLTLFSLFSLPVWVMTMRQMGVIYLKNNCIFLFLTTYHPDMGRNIKQGINYRYLII